MYMYSHNGCNRHAMYMMLISNNNLPEILDMVPEFLQLEQVPHGVTVEEGLRARSPVDVWGGQESC